MALVERMAKDAKVSVDYLRLVAMTASRRYKTYKIPKRSGGMRQIEHPSREVKYLQRWLVRHVLLHFPVHGAATAYRHGIGIRDNALIHLDRNFLLKLDFKDFFPSIRRGDVLSFLSSNKSKLKEVGVFPEDIETVIDLVCRNGALAIGAPSSPVLSNIMMFDLDADIEKYCAEAGVAYSRYADDLSFSTDKSNILGEVIDHVRNLVASTQSPKLKLNEDKSVFTSRKRQRIVTGVYLTSESKLSVGRGKKRQIRTLLYLMGIGKLSEEDSSYLSGYLSFVNYIEPEFLLRLRSKFGDDLVDSAIGIELDSRKGSGPL